MHHHFLHSLELIVVLMISVSTFWFWNLTGLNQDLYRNNDSEVAQQLLTAMQNPTVSLKQGNIISIWNMDTEVENTFAKWYCTYWAARISPEFFPFTDEKTQQRTWWWNAVDRCKNASDTWYKVWTTPSQWALIVYDAGGKFWSFGHVGKVLHYDKTLKKIIVRDMARVARWSMSDRREDLTTANVKCYIYNSKKDITVVDPTIVPINTGSTITTWTITPIQPDKPVIILPPEEPVVVTPTQPEQPVIVTPPEEPVVIIPPLSQEVINKPLVLTFDKLSDIAQHFVTQNDIIFTLISKSPLKLWETATLTLEIKDKKTGEAVSTLLPFSFTILSTNDIIKENISNIQMINNWSVDISILGQKIWTSTIVIYMDGTKVGEFSLEVK